jgi:hypothetical protein
MKVWTLTESYDYDGTNILGIYTTPELAKAACWQEAEAYPDMQDTVESTEDGAFLSIRVGNKVFEVNEHEVISA